MLVVDASVAVKWFVRETDHGTYLAAVRDERLAAPDRMFLEVANVLRRKVRPGEIAAEQAGRALQRLPRLIDVVVPSVDLLVEAFELSGVLGHSVYDCAYLACARLLEAGLITADARFAAKAAANGLEAFLYDTPIENRVD